MILHIGFRCTVFKGEHQPTGRPVVIKLLRPEHSQIAEERDRFCASVKALSSLNGLEGIAWPTRYSFGKQEDLYFVQLPFVDGLVPDLDWEYTRSYKRATTIAMQLAQILVHVHGRKVVHGAISPGNMLLSGGSGSNVITTLVGFGQACLLDQGEREHSVDFPGTDCASDLNSALRHTTPEDAPYIAPWRFDGEPPSEAADIYGVGAVLFGLLTGQPPYRGATTQEVADDQRNRTRAQVLRYLRDSNPRLPSDLRVIVERAMFLHDDRGQHYTSAQQLHKDLEKLLEETSAPTGPLGPVLRVEPEGAIDFGVVEPTAGVQEKTITVTSRSRYVAQVKKVESTADWLELSATEVQPRSTEQIQLRVFPDRLKEVDNVATLLVTAPETPRGVSRRCKVHLKSVTKGVDLLVLIDTIGDDDRVRRRLDIAEDIIINAKSRLSSYGELRVCVIPYWDWDHRKRHSEQKPYDEQDLQFTKPGVAITYLSSVNARHEDGYDFDCGLDAALCAAELLKWNRSSFRIAVIIGSRPPHTMHPTFAEQTISPGRKDWEQALTRMRTERPKLLTIGLRSRFYYYAGNQLPKYARAYANKSWDQLGDEGLYTYDDVDSPGPNSHSSGITEQTIATKTLLDILASRIHNLQTRNEV